MSSNTYRFFKRLFDVIASGSGLIILSPLFVVMAICIKQGSRGPVFYRGLRAGLLGNPFRIFKFRTMVVNADQIGGPSTPEDDPRITRLGAWLRRYKLDELPQLVNVMKGEMSLVGPRPEVFEEVKLYTTEECRLLEVLPGITDWASIKFRNEGELLRGSGDPHQTYREKIRPEKVRLGLEYIERRSFSVDLSILRSTLQALWGFAPDTRGEAGSVKERYLHD